MSEQLALYPVELEEDKAIYLNIVKDGRAVRLGLAEIFDSKTYDELYVTTFVSSPVFFSKIARGFNKVDFILGIADSEVLSKFADSWNNLVNSQEKLIFWNNLHDEIKDKVRDNRINIRYGILGVAIHSKIYLMRSSQSGLTRTIIGSANLSESAFLERKQYEEILIFDNSPLFEVYLERFKWIYRDTLDYIPDRCKRAKKTEIIYTSDPETLTSVLVEQLQMNHAKIKITEEQFEDIKTLPAKYIHKKQQVETSSKLIDLVTKKSKDGYSVKPIPTITENIIALKTLVSRTNKSSEQIDTRIFYKYLDKDATLLIEDDTQKDTLIPFSESICREKIKSGLEVIEKFVQSYNLYTSYPDTRNQAKVFEVILYSFMSPYIWKIRDSYATLEGRSGARSDIPPFLIIGGRSGSGKTTLLEFVSLLLGNSGKRYFAYQEVSKGGIIRDYFCSENLYPIQIDEIPINFFESKAADKGENLIKFIGNDLNTKHPVLIGTTNLTDFYVAGQVSRRIYYLQIDKVFDKRRRTESSKYLTELLSQVEGSLFKDFTYRASKVLVSGESFYLPNDFLHLARGIFRDYYREADMPLPAWFPDQPFFDYEDRGRDLWIDALSIHRDYFDYRKDGTIFVDIDKFCRDNRQRSTYINYLNPACIKEDNVMLILWEKAFLDFVGRKKERRGVFNKLATIFGVRK